MIFHRREVTATDHHVALFDGEMDALLRTATQHYALVDVNTHEADLEEIFLEYYREGAPLSEAFEGGSHLAVRVLPGN